MQNILRAATSSCLLGLGLIASGPGAAFAADAKELFVSSRCVRCHSVESQGIAAKPRDEEEEIDDLSHVGAQRTAEWIRQYLRKEADLEGKKHGPKFRGSGAELQTLASWLASLK